MSVPQCTRFVSECITWESGKQSGLHEDEMYGVYLSWCFLNREKPSSATSLWAAVSQQTHLEPHRVASRRVWPGLSMTGPAVVDYILASQPSLV